LPENDQPDKPTLLARLRARYPWLDHLVLAMECYRDRKGDFFAAGITYFTVFALLPLLMVGFSIAGLVLSRRQDLKADLVDRIKNSVSGDLKQQIINLMDAAINSAASVGVIGIAVALWAGLGWMSNLRAALSAMWEQPLTKPKFLRSKLSDLVALLSVFGAIAMTVALSALGNKGLMRKVLSWIGLQDAPGVSLLLRIASLVVALGISWLLFSWMIARLPREKVSYRSAVRAGLLAAVGFELFKQLGTVYVRGVMHGPAGTTFGGVLGLFVFAYITARLILFATAWAATSAENLAAADVAPPEPAVIVPRDLGSEGVGVRAALAAGAVGALGALGLSWLRRR
jgi:membrane protein